MKLLTIFLQKDTAAPFMIRQGKAPAMHLLSGVPGLILLEYKKDPNVNSFRTCVRPSTDAGLILIK